MTCEFYGYSCEGVGALASAFIAVLALLATIWQACVTRKHNRLSVRPLLSTWNHAVPNGYRIDLTNIGVGPALIDTFKIYVDGQKIDGKGTEPIHKAVKILFPTGTPAILHSSYLAKGGALGAKEGITLVQIQFTPETLPTPEVFEHMQKRVKLLVTYKSIYEDKTITYDSILNHEPAN